MLSERNQDINLLHLLGEWKKPSKLRVGNKRMQTIHFIIVIIITLIIIPNKQRKPLLVLPRAAVAVEVEDVQEEEMDFDE